MPRRAVPSPPLLPSASANSRLRQIATRVERWFEQNQRPLPWRRGYDPYQVWVSEIMLQQTRMEVVLGYFERFISRFPDVASLAAASENDVLAQWSGLGYYRRARMLRQGAVALHGHHHSQLPSSADALRKIPGIGRYTAGAIASIAFGQKEPIVDGNVARVVSRLELIEHPAGSPALIREAWTIATALVSEADDARMLNQGLMELGALLCTPRNPRCLLCPLNELCGAARSGRADELPHAKAKGATRQLSIELFVVSDDSGRVLMRREAGPLMNAMWHLPHGSSDLLGGRSSMQVSERLGTFRHTVTNRRITFEVCTASGTSLGESDGEVAWIDLESLSEYPHPSYVRKALVLAGMLPRKGSRLSSGI